MNNSKYSCWWGFIFGLVIATVPWATYFIYEKQVHTVVNEKQIENTDSERGFTTGTRVYFSPRGGCTDAIVQTIGEAEKQILVQAYVLTSDKIAAALVTAKKRGVIVKVILDKAQSTGLGADASVLAQGGVEVYLDGNHKIAHNKVIIIDDYTVLTGSFNYSAAAEDSNAENLLILKNATLTAKYKANWDAHILHSVLYVPTVTP